MEKQPKLSHRAQTKERPNYGKFLTALFRLYIQAFLISLVVNNEPMHFINYKLFTSHFFVGESPEDWIHLANDWMSLLKNAFELLKVIIRTFRESENQKELTKTIKKTKAKKGDKINNPKPLIRKQNRKKRQVHIHLITLLGLTI